MWLLRLIAVGAVGFSSACVMPEALLQQEHQVDSNVESVVPVKLSDPAVCSAVFRELPVVEASFDGGLDYLESGAYDAYDVYVTLTATATEMGLSSMEEKSRSDPELNQKLLLFAGELRKLRAHTDAYARDLDSGAALTWSEDYFDRWVEKWADISLEKDRFLQEADDLCGNVAVSLGSVWLEPYG